MGGQQSSSSRPQQSLTLPAPSIAEGPPLPDYSDEAFTECLNIYLQLQAFLELAIRYLEQGGSAAEFMRRAQMAKRNPNAFAPLAKGFYDFVPLDNEETTRAWLLDKLQQLNRAAQTQLNFLQAWRTTPDELRAEWRRRIDMRDPCSPDNALDLATDVVAYYPDPPAHIVYRAFQFRPQTNDMSELAEMEPPGQATTPYNTVSYVLGGLMYPQAYYGAPLQGRYGWLVGELVYRFPGLNFDLFRMQKRLMTAPTAVAYTGQDPQAMAAFRETVSRNVVVGDVQNIIASFVRGGPE